MVFYGEETVRAIPNSAPLESMTPPRSAHRDRGLLGQTAETDIQQCVGFFSIKNN
jgi:hypothetical protein